MQKKSSIKQNILQFIDYKGISKYKFYQDTGITRSVLDQKTGMSEENTAKFLAYFPEVNIEWLFTGNGPMLRNEIQSEVIAENYNVFNFQSAGAAGEALILMNEDKYKGKPDIYIPGLGSGIHIQTPVSGDSMHSTIKDGDRAISTMIREWSDMRQGYIYAVIDQTDGLVYKRLYWTGKKPSQLDFVSDNEIYRDYTRKMSDIQAIFKVRGVYTTDLRPYWTDLRREMREVRQEIRDIQRQIRK